MKSKIFTFLLVILSLVGFGSKTNATTITAVAAGDWATAGTWDNGVPTATDSVVISGYAVTINTANAVCLSLTVSGTGSTLSNPGTYTLKVGDATNNVGGYVTVSNGGTVTFTAPVYLYSLTVGSTGIFQSSTVATTQKDLYMGYRGGVFKAGTVVLQNDGQFGGATYGVTGSGIRLFYSELVSSYTFQGSGVTNLGAMLASGGTQTQDLLIDFKQNVSFGNTGYWVGLFNNAAASATTYTRTLQIEPGKTLSSGAKFGANSTAPSILLGNFIYNIYGTLDLSVNLSGDFDMYTTTNTSSSTQKITVNLGNGTDYAVLKLPRYFKLVKSQATQSITLNLNNPNSKVVFTGGGALTNTITSAGTTDYTLFPNSFRSLSLDNAYGGTIPTQFAVTDSTIVNYTSTTASTKWVLGTAYPTTGTITVYLGQLIYGTDATKVYKVTTGGTIGGATVVQPTDVSGSIITDPSGGTASLQYVGLIPFSGSLTVNSAYTNNGNASGAGTEFIGGAAYNVAGNFTSNNTGGSLCYNYLNISGVNIAGNTVIGNGGGYLKLGKSLTVAGGLSLNGNVVVGAFTLTLGGSVSGLGNLDLSTNTAVLTLNGTTDQTVSNFLNGKAYRLTVNKTSGNASLASDLEVTNSLILTKGTLSLGSKNLIVSGSLTSTASNYVVTNGAGKLTLTTADATKVTFPIGASTTSYDPVSATPSTGTTISAKVSATLSGTPVYGVRYNQKEWDITPTAVSSTLIELTPSVLAESVTSPVIGHYVAGSYVNSSATVTGSTFSGIFTSFSPFVTGANINVTAIATGSDNSLKVYTNAIQLIVSGTQTNDLITVYGLNGQTMAKLKANGVQTVLNLNSGVYVVKVNEFKTKVIL